MAAVSKNTGTMSWGEPAQIADSKERFACGRCGAERGVYGQHFGIAPDGNPVPIIKEFSFDITLTEHSLATKCWNCTFSFYQVLKKEKDNGN